MHPVAIWRESCAIGANYEICDLDRCGTRDCISPCYFLYAAEHSVTLGDLQADYVLAPKAGSSAAADISGLATQVNPRDLLGPSKAIKADPQLPSALGGK